MRLTSDFARTLDICREVANVWDMGTSGLDLRLERVAARVKQQDLAKAMGRHRASVITYEKAAVVSDEVAARYRKALATFTEVAEEGDAA